MKSLFLVKSINLDNDTEETYIVCDSLTSVEQQIEGTIVSIQRLTPTKVIINGDIVLDSTTKPDNGYTVNSTWKMLID